MGCGGGGRKQTAGPIQPRLEKGDSVPVALFWMKLDTQGTTGPDHRSKAHRPVIGLAGKHFGVFPRLDEIGMGEIHPARRYPERKTTLGRSELPPPHLGNPERKPKRVLSTETAHGRFHPAQTPTLPLLAMSAKKKTNPPPRDWARRCEDAGCGELIVNSIDRDGSMEGYDLELLKEVAQAVSIPVIALGGAGSLPHLRQGLAAGASAVAAGSMFVFHGPRRAVLITYSQSLLIPEEPTCTN